MGSAHEGKVALVTGATGYTGREVVRQLQGMGVRVLAHVRPGSEAAGRLRASFRTWGAEVMETPWDPAALAGLISRERPDVIFALYGTTKRRAKREGLRGDIYRLVDFGLTSILVEAALQAGSEGRIVYLSSLGANPDSKNPYLAARGEAEKKIRESGLPYVIARPSFIHGPGRDRPRLGEGLMSWISDRALAIAGRLGAQTLRDRYRSIDNRRLASALIRMAMDPEAGGKIFPGEEIQRLALPND